MKLKKIMGMAMISSLVVSSFAACGKEKETNTEPTTAPMNTEAPEETPTEIPPETPTDAPTEAPTETPTATPEPEPASNVVFSYDASAKSQSLYFQDRGNGNARWVNTDGHDSSECFMVTGRGANWHGTSLTIPDEYIGKVLHVSYWTKHENPEPFTVSCTLQVTKPDGSQDWPERANNENVPAGEWTLVEGDIAIYPDAADPIIYWEATETYDFYIDDVVVTVVEGVEAEAHYQDLVVDTPELSDVDSISLTFNDENLFFTNRGDGTPAIVSGGHDDDFAMQVTGRTANWQGAQADLSSYGLAGRTINISYWVKAEETTEVNVTLEEASAAGTNYNRVASSGDLTPGEWTQVTGTIVVGAETTKPILYFESPSETASFMIDEVVISFEGEAAVADDGENAVTGGGANEIAGAPIEPGSVLYYNSFENALGNYLDGSNSFNYATNENAVGVAHEGNESVLVKSREYDNAGCGLRISAVNGLSAADLQGHTVEFSVWVMFEDGAFTTAPDSINFTIWNRQKKVDTDADGNAVYEIALEQVVNKGEWTQLVATLEITDGIDNGMLLIGTQGEESATGYLSAYYMDEMQLKVVE